MKLSRQEQDLLALLGLKVLRGDARAAKLYTKAEQEQFILNWLDKAKTWPGDVKARFFDPDGLFT